MDFAQARRNMVDGQVRTFDVSHIPLLAALEDVPRERFVAPGRETLAYSDEALPVSDGAGGEERRFMVKPMFLARLVQALAVEAGEKVLDVACGLGYSSAVLARLGAQVVALEASEALAAGARERLGSVGASAVTVVAGPLEGGYPAEAPYDVILINGLVEVSPRGLLNQLADGGRLACIERVGRSGRAMLYIRSGDAFGSRSIFDAAAPALAAFKAEPGFVF
jgi:protein-L-isoaspartate(D-aspartate) O-methyltransferase